jgi:hypothetical protein
MVASSIPLASRCDEMSGVPRGGSIERSRGRAAHRRADKPSNELPPFYYINVVWGSHYVDLFTNFSIPTLLAPGNIPGTANRDVSEFLIVTTEKDANQIKSSPIFGQLSKTIKVVFLHLETTDEGKYNQMNYGHSLALNYVARRGFCIFLAPDAIIANGTVQKLVHLVTQGRRVVMGFGPRVEQDTMIRDLRNSPEYQENMLAYEPRRLVELSLPNLHQDLRNHFFDSIFFPEQPYACIWPAPNRDGMLVRSLNLHPYLFDSCLIPATERFDWRTMTIDWNVVPRYVNDWNELYIEKDSDNICILGMTAAGTRAKPNVQNRVDAEALGLWLLRHRYELINRISFLYPIVFHSEPLNRQWNDLIRRTGEFALQVVDPARGLRGLTLLGHALAKDIKDRGTMRDTPGTRTTQMNRETRGWTAEPTVHAVRVVSEKPIPFFYGFTVWGERYADYLCRFALPSFLSPRNIPALPNNNVSKFVIATTPQDENRIRSHPIFDVLGRIVSVEFVYLPIPAEGLPTVDNHPGKYNLLSVGHSMAADQATGRGCALFLGPDAIYSDGFLSRLYEMIESGKEVVVGMGPRVNEETIVPELTELGLLKNGEPLVAPPRRAVELMLRHLHQDARLLRWSSPLFPYPPYMCIWDIGGGDGILLRSFSLHPYIVDYRSGSRPRPQDTSAVDASFIINCMIPWNKIHQVTDSDEFIVLSMTSMHHKDYLGTVNSSPQTALAASSQRPDITVLHRNYFMNAIKMHVGELNDRWTQLEQETLKIAYDILNQPAAPVVNQPALLVVNHPGTPLVDQPATPLVDEPATPLVDEPATPVADQPPTPVVDEPATPIRKITAAEVNEAIAAKTSGVSGRLAAQLVIHRLLRQLMPWK